MASNTIKLEILVIKVYTLVKVIALLQQEVNVSIIRLDHLEVTQPSMVFMDLVLTTGTTTITR